LSARARGCARLGVGGWEGEGESRREGEWEPDALLRVVARCCALLQGTIDVHIDSKKGVIHAAQVRMLVDLCERLCAWKGARQAGGGVGGYWGGGVGGVLWNLRSQGRADGACVWRQVFSDSLYPLLIETLAVSLKGPPCHLAPCHMF